MRKFLVRRIGNTLGPAYNEHTSAHKIIVSENFNADDKDRNFLARKRDICCNRTPCKRDRVQVKLQLFKNFSSIREDKDAQQNNGSLHDVYL